MLLKVMRALELMTGYLLSCLGVGIQIATVVSCVFLLLIGPALNGWHV